MRAWWLLLVLLVLSGCAVDAVVQAKLSGVCTQNWGKPLVMVMHKDGRTMECHYWSGVFKGFTEHDVTFIDENTTIVGDYISTVNVTVT